MLLSFRVSNFRSIRDEQEFSFLRGTTMSRSPDSDEDSKAPQRNPQVGTVAGVFGANASGKSNLLKALDFMQDAVLDSYRKWAPGDTIPVQPFLLDPEYENEPSLFEAVFSLGKTRFQYGFRLTSKQVVGEWLYAYSTHRRTVWFERDVSSDPQYYFGKSFPGRNRVIADLTRPTSLFLSTAAANNHKRVDAVDHWFRAHLRSVTPDDRPARIQYTKGLSNRPERWKELIKLMQFADLGICEARVRKEQLAETERERIVRVLRAVDPSTVDEEAVQQSIDEVTSIVEFAHSVNNHDDKPVYLPFGMESLGTQAWFSLAGPVLRAINNGDTLMVDELDSSLHPHLTSEILKIFRDPEKNRKQAQILFTTHDTTLLGTLLGERELLRDQVWFTEKRQDGATVLYPLTDFSPRKAENLERGYLQGRYGAVPFLDEAILDKIAAKLEPSPDHSDEDGDALVLNDNEGDET